jgi:WD40 repeat protein
LDTCAATIRPPCASTVCCADFSGSHEHLVSLACSSHKAYIYDLRATSQPLVVLQGHTRPVSYARFFGADKLVSASTDGTLAAWDLAAALELEQQQHQQVVLPPQGSRQCSPILQQQHGEDEDIMEATAGRRRQAKPASTPFANSSGSTATHAALSGSCSSQQPDAPALTAAAAAGAVGWRSSSPVATGSSCSSVVPASRCWGSGSMAVVTPWKSFRGHTNAKNFVGLSVRPEDGLLACGSETSEVFTYHTSWDKPLATFGLDSSSCASNGSSSSCSMGGAPAAAAGAMGPAGVAPFVSAVAWQSWQASHSLGLPAVLAAASSMGTIKILSLVEA